MRILRRGNFSRRSLWRVKCACCCLFFVYDDVERAFAGLRVVVLGYLTFYGTYSVLVKVCTVARSQLALFFICRVGTFTICVRCRFRVATGNVVVKLFTVLRMTPYRRFAIVFIRGMFCVIFVQPARRIFGAGGRFGIGGLTRCANCIFGMGATSVRASSIEPAVYRRHGWGGAFGIC